MCIRLVFGVLLTWLSFSACQDEVICRSTASCVEVGVDLCEGPTDLKLEVDYFARQDSSDIDLDLDGNPDLRLKYRHSSSRGGGGCSSQAVTAVLLNENLQIHGVIVTDTILTFYRPREDFPFDCFYEMEKSDYQPEPGDTLLHEAYHTYLLVDRLTAGNSLCVVNDFVHYEEASLLEYSYCGMDSYNCGQRLYRNGNWEREDTAGYLGFKLASDIGTRLGYLRVENNFSTINISTLSSELVGN